MSDTDTLANLLAEHVQDGVRCSCGADMGRPRESDETGFRTKFDHEKHRAHVAAVVAESGWLREARAEAWDEGHAADCALCQRWPDDPKHANPYRTTEDEGSSCGDCRPPSRSGGFPIGTMWCCPTCEGLWYADEFEWKFHSRQDNTTDRTHKTEP